MAQALIERESQWSRLMWLAERASAGKGQVALVGGPIACGRTALLDLFGEQTSAAGFSWLRAVGSAAEQSLPYGILGQLLGPGTVPAPAEAADEAVRLTAVHVGCRELLERAAAGPVLITVDDVQHADAASLDWLLACVRRISGAAVLLVLTETSGPRPGTSRLHAELQGHRHFTRLAVAPLSRCAVPDPEEYELTGGNPLLVTAWRQDGGAAGPHYRQALQSCLLRGGPGVIEAARSIAVLDAPSESDAAVLLAHAGLLDDGVFRHAELRTAVLAGLDPDERAELYAWAAAERQEHGAPPAEVAPLLAESGRADPGWAVGVLVVAADDAVRRDRPGDAVRYLELARTSAHGAVRTTIVATLARIERRVRPATAARHLTELTGADLTEQDAAALVRDLLWYGRSADAAAVLETVRTAGAPAGLELWLAGTHPVLARRGPRPAGRPEQTAPAAGPHDRSTAALLAALGRGPAGPAIADAELILQSARPGDTYVWAAETALQALLVLVYTDRLDAAHSWCAALLSSASTELAVALFTAVQAEIALRRGELSAAFTDAVLALQSVPAPGWGVAAGLPLGTAVTAATRMDRRDEAAQLLAQPVPDAMLQSRYGLHYLHARGEHYLATGRDYAALADFLACGKLTAEWGMDIPGLVPWRTSAAEAWLRKSENRAEVRRLLNEQLGKVGPDSSRARGTALRLLAATSQAHSRPQLLAEAVAILESCGDRFALARALADLSRAYRAVGQPRRASPMARLAAQVAEDCGAAILYDEILPLRTGVAVTDERNPRDRLASLTESEARVASLAAVGLTNREISVKLFLATSTIEQHLTRVYRKLQVKHRHELPAELQRHQSTAA